MNKFIILVVLIAIGLGLAFYIGGNSFNLTTEISKIQITPPLVQQVPKTGPKGGPLPFALEVDENFNLGVFANLGNDLPRTMAFDQEGNLIVAATKTGKILALPDKDGNGVADETVEVASGLDRPHGLAFAEDTLYLAETGQVSIYQYNPEDFSASASEVLFSLPSGGRHFSRTIKINDDKLYTSVGSSCDTCLEGDSKRASILVSDLAGNNLTMFAKGLRNTVYFTFDSSGRMWGADMGRDFLGDNLPPEEVNVIEQGGDYGWPYCYGNRVRDLSFRANENLDYCNSTVLPNYNLPAHIAPLGIAFIDENSLLLAEHGSWNSSVPVGYKVILLTLQNGQIISESDFITGFIKGERVMGRPADVVVSTSGEIYISDDNAGLIYIVTKK